MSDSIQQMLPEKVRLKVVKSMLKRLSRESQLTVKKQIQLTGTLDYAKQPIQMVVESNLHTARLSSCAREPNTVAWLEAYMKPDDVLYDIGANVGAYSLVAAAFTQGKCLVYSFEPSFTTYGTLCQNVVLNHFEQQIVPFQLGLSNETGLKHFHYSSLASGRASHGLGETGIEGSDDASFNPVYSQPMLSYRLDDFIAQFKLQPPNLMKIDVDRAIDPVVEGAEQTLRHPALRTVLIELFDHAERYATTMQRMADAGFVLKERFVHADPHLSDHLFVRP